MAAAGTNGCFELAGLFASSLQKEAKRCQYYRLSLRKRNVAKVAPEAREWQETGG